jgi:signal transduction histidine kinase
MLIHIHLGGPLQWGWITDETHQLIETSRQLSEKSAELERAARQLSDANERLRALDAQKDEFLSQVSHELRTPMTSIRSLSEILMDDGAVSAAERARFVSIIHGESLRLSRLLDEILDISRLESGAANLVLEVIDARAAVRAALDIVSGMVREQGVAVDADRVPEGLAIRANADRLRQVLINVLSNAIKYNTSAEPRIVLRARTAGAQAWIDVIDNGGGVGHDEAARIFEKFTRGVRADGNHGAGLGLPISRAIMRAFGGDLTVEFASDGTSFFRLAVPRDMPAPVDAARPEPAAV